MSIRVGVMLTLNTELNSAPNFYLVKKVNLHYLHNNTSLVCSGDQKAEMKEIYFKIGVRCKQITYLSWYKGMWHIHVLFSTAEKRI